MASTSIQEQDSSVIPTSLFLLSSLLLVSAASKNNSHKEGEGVGEEGKERVGDVGEEGKERVGEKGNVGVGVGVGDAGNIVPKSGVTFGPSSSTGQYLAQGPSRGPSPSTFQSPEDEEYSKLIAAITQQYMRTYNYISLELRSLDTIFKHNVNNLEKLNHHLEDFGININKVTNNNICINFTSKKKAITIKAKYTARLTAKLEKLMNLRDKTSILKTIDEHIDTITNINILNNLLKPYNIHLSANVICIKRKTDQDEANEDAANEEDDKAEALAAVKAAIEVETEEAQTAEEVANETDEQAKAEQAKAEQAKAEQAKAEQAKAEQARLANEAAERAKANEAEEAARTIQRQRRRRINSYITPTPFTRAMRVWSANSRNPD